MTRSPGPKTGETTAKHALREDALEVCVVRVAEISREMRGPGLAWSPPKAACRVLERNTWAFTPPFLLPNRARCAIRREPSAGAWAWCD
jgi:hypothetical protein